MKGFFLESENANYKRLKDSNLEFPNISFVFVSRHIIPGLLILPKLETKVSQ